ncbi:hypothetical protein J6590_100040 [Homalodisca vitripennis]|nr:hypothetical protein J6590_100040 [Homalodisca vitripennis]
MEHVEVVRKRRKKGEGRLSDDIKIRRNSGKPYMNKNNVLVPGKQPPNDVVSCKSKYKCKSLLHAQKSLLFTELYEVDHTKQQNYLLGLINIKPVVRRRPGTYENTTQSRRQATAIYTVPNGEGELCQSTFREIFSLTVKRVQGLVTLKQTGNPMYTEKRGNKIKHRKFTEVDTQNVCDHINSIPREVSHYGRTKTESICHQTKILIGYIELSGGSILSPLTDTCGRCDLLAAKIKASEGDEKNLLTAQQKLHHLKAENARKAMKTDYTEAQQPNSNTTVFSLDLQQSSDRTEPRDLTLLTTDPGLQHTVELLSVVTASSLTCAARRPRSGGRGYNTDVIAR